MQHQHIDDFLRHLNTLHSDKSTLGCDTTLRKDSSSRPTPPKHKAVHTHATNDPIKAESLDSSKPKQRHVSFSTMSKVHLYKKDKLYSRNVAFSKEDFDEFSARALYDADRIRRLIITVPPPSASFASSIKYLLRNNIITAEELLGIEGMILYGPSRVFKVRRKHCKAVLKRQKEQRLKVQQQQQQQQQQQLTLQDDPSVALGKFARKNSDESRRRARARAAVRCHFYNPVPCFDKEVM
jgi:hypothetical protein